MKDDCSRLAPTQTGWTGHFQSPQLRLAAALVLLAGWPQATLAVTEARDYAVLVSASVLASPPQIILNWPQDTFDVLVRYAVSRKAPESTSWTLLGTLSGNGTNFADTNVTAKAALRVPGAEKRDGVCRVRLHLGGRGGAVDGGARQGAVDP